MRRVIWPLFLLLILVAITAHADESMPNVTAVEVLPSQYLAEEDIRSAITQTKVGQPLDIDKLMADVSAIQSLGTELFEVELAASGDGVKVIFSPIIIQGFDVDIDAVPLEQFLESFPLKPGQILDIEALEIAIGQALETLYDRTGLVFYETAERTLDDSNRFTCSFVQPGWLRSQFKVTRRRVIS